MMSDLFNVFKKKIFGRKKNPVDYTNDSWFSDNVSLKTKIVLRDHDTQDILYEGHNKVILPGAGFLARYMFGIDALELTPSYNNALNLDMTDTMDLVVNNPNQIAETPLKTCLWCVGIDGCGRENSQVFDVDYRRWIDRENIVPFQYLKKSRDLNAALRDVYFGRQTRTDVFAYYFKTFNSEPKLVQQFTDGTPIDHTVYSQALTTNTPIESYVITTMSLTKYDCRDYFINTVGINNARVNTIELCCAWYKMIGGFKYYQSIRPVTKLNFPNEPLIDLRKGIDIEYLVYF